MSELVSLVDPNCFRSDNPTNGPVGRGYYLLPPKTSTNLSGPWLNVGVLKASTAQIYGTFGGASVELFASNDPNPASSADPGISLGAALTTAGMVVINAPYGYIRAIVTNAGEDTSLNAALHGVG